MNLSLTRSDRMASRRGLAAMCGLLALSAVAAPTQAQCSPQELAKLIASDPAAGDIFGCSVAASGDTAVVGNYYDVHSGLTDAGSAYVFVRAGGVWTQQTKLTASDAAASDQFGYSVAISGETIVVGARYDSHVGVSYAGSAYVFTRTGGVWSEQAKLIASDAAGSDYFGNSVAVSGDTAVVGSYYDTHAGGSDAGSAYVFVRSGVLWTQQAKLTASDAAVEDYFGISVALSGDTAVVGAYYDDHAGGTYAGSAYVFVRTGTFWVEQTKLLASDAAANDYFGTSVAVSGDTAVVGAPNDDHSIPVKSNAGSAYVFVRAGVLWTQQTKLTASDAAEFDNFGTSVAVSGDTVVAGADSDGHAAGLRAGSAYVFTRTGVEWIQRTKLIASDAAANDNFGNSVAVLGDTAVVGAYDDNLAGGIAAGSALVFDLCCLDSDGDGTRNCDDDCPNDASKIAPGVCGCGVADTDTDTDADGLSDCVDNCPTVANADQADADNNGVGDLCVNAPGSQTNPACGQQGSTCGMGMAGLLPMMFLMLRWVRPTRRR
ncbi:MAG: FG-GAP repeat protein [Planctomycetota bacterium]